MWEVLTFEPVKNYGFVGSCLQENNKTKHPMLLYEAKLYSILQGASMCGKLGGFSFIG